jgi:hypothetical protein
MRVAALVSALVIFSARLLSFAVAELHGIRRRGEEGVSPWVSPLLMILLKNPETFRFSGNWGGSLGRVTGVASIQNTEKLPVADINIQITIVLCSRT